MTVLDIKPNESEAGFTVTGRVLVADDEEGLRSLLTIRLEQAGFEVTTATDGADAIDHLEATPTFDALILDLGMPRVDGYEVLEALEDLEVAPLTVVLSGHDSDDTRERALALGADEYVVKPFDAAELATLLDDRLD